MLERPHFPKLGTMSQRQVIKAKVKLFPHPNAEKLELCKVGPFQLVVQKGLYQGGDTVIVAPEKAVLPPHLAQHYTNTDTGVSYLRGENHDRVGIIRLRGELSQGVVIPNTGYEHLPFDHDLSSELGITFWEPPIPQSLMGDVENLSSKVTVQYTHHDVEQFGIYQAEFVQGEEVLLTEKLHGSQGIYYRNPDGDWSVTSKGLSQRGLGLKASDGNSYWQAAHNMGLFAAVQALSLEGDLQIFGEVIPIQKGFSYGQSKVTVKIFKVVKNGEVQAYDHLEPWFREHFVPILYRGPYTLERLLPLKEGLETVSGKGLHIKEGAVLTPIRPRKNAEYHDLTVKLISEKYAKKETGDELS